MSGGVGRRAARGRISGSQFAALVFLIIISLVLRSAVAVIVGIAGRDAWIAMWLAASADLAVAVMLAALAARHPGRTMFQYSVDLLGGLAGGACGVVFALFFLSVNAMQLWELGEFLVTSFLPETPPGVLVAAVVALGCYAARGGLEVIARLGEGLAALFFAAFVLLLALVAKDAEPVLLLPVLERGWGPVMLAALVPSSIFGVCIIMGAFIPYHRRPARSLTVKMTGVLVATSLIALGIAASVTVFGAPYTARLAAPILALTKYIHVAQFFERVELLWLTIWVGSGVVAAASLNWAAAMGLAQSLGMRDFRPLVWPIGLLAAGLSQRLFDNLLVAEAFMRTAFPPFALSVEVGLTAFLLVISLLRGRQVNRSSGLM